ncbi:hypothetical protein B8W90_12430, partial [Staphylococcus hominis]
MAVATYGRLLVGNADRGPMWVSPDPSQASGSRIDELGGPDMEGVTALYRDGNGTLWVGGARGTLSRLGATGLEKVALPPELEGDGMIG